GVRYAATAWMIANSRSTRALRPATLRSAAPNVGACTMYNADAVRVSGRASAIGSAATATTEPKASAVAVPTHRYVCMATFLFIVARISMILLHQRNVDQLTQPGSARDGLQITQVSNRSGSEQIARALLAADPDHGLALLLVVDSGTDRDQPESRRDGHMGLT